MLLAPGQKAVPAQIALEPLAKDHTREILELLAGRGRVRRAELEQLVEGSSRQTLMRHADYLHEMGAFEKASVGEGGIEIVEYRMLAPGRELLEVARRFDALFDQAGLSAVNGEDRHRRGRMIELVRHTWEITLLARIAEGSKTAAEIYREMGEGPARTSLYRLVGELTDAGFLESVSLGRQNLLRVTKLGTGAVGPIVWAHRWEARNCPELMAPIDPLFIRAAFRLALARTTVARTTSGVFSLICRQPKMKIAGVTFSLDGEGEITYLPFDPRKGTVIYGTPAAWMEAVTQADPDGMKLRGEQEVAGRILAAIYIAISGVPKSREGGR